MKLPQHPALPWLSVALLAYLSGDLITAALERQFSGAPRRSTSTTATTNTTAVLNGLKLPDELRAVLTNRSSMETVNNTVTNGTTGTPPVVTGGPQPGGVTTVNATGLPMLAGTMEGQGQSLAVLQMGQETQVVAVGEEWMGFRVMEVTSFEARLKDARGQEHTVTMAMAGAQAAPPPTTAAPNITTPGNATAGNGTDAPNTGPYKSSRELRADIEGRAFIRNILVQPVNGPDGDVIGIRVNYSTMNNPFARLGMQSGDIIQTFNSKPVKGMQDMDWALKELRNAQSLNFELQRNGQKVPLTVQLEP
jgi:hypothetical protein